ncbi:hypothetical protein GCM10007385_43780 [Tateyamaria omphalii]|nr:hypothetical protein GCM10007385_43780 [Tateyamaria omphalii]
MPEEKTFYEHLVQRWQNSRPIAIVIFSMVAVLAGISAYQTLSGFWFNLTDNGEELAAFNDNVQPIYFEGRVATLVDHDCLPIDQIARAIIEIQPRQIIIRSHTSKVNIGINRDLTLERGTLIGNELHARLGADYEGKIVVIAFGGALTQEHEGQYRERVEVSLSNDVGVPVGHRVLAAKIPAQGSLVPPSVPVPSAGSPCLLTAG